MRTLRCGACTVAAAALGLLAACSSAVAQLPPLLALAGCGLVATAQPLDTAAPALKLTLWVEWPVLRTDRPQVAHAVVASAQGERLRGVTVQGQLTRPGAEPLQLMFSVTDADGYATAVFPMFEAPDASETHRLVAQAAINADYGVAMIEYEVQP